MERYGLLVASYREQCLVCSCVFEVLLQAGDAVAVVARQVDC